eukprot:8298560-Pyramimonas_sp.AAC.2
MGRKGSGVGLVRVDAHEPQHPPTILEVCTRSGSVHGLPTIVISHKSDSQEPDSVYTTPRARGWGLGGRTLPLRVCLVSGGPPPFLLVGTPPLSSALHA